MSVLRLVVNADDLGLHPRIDEGILRAHAEGVVTSATVLVTGRNAERSVPAAKAAGLGLGVHLALVGGLEPALPPEQVSTLAPGGRLRASWSQLVRDVALRRVRLEELRAELHAQLMRARELGFEPDHLDTHQHLHLLPGIAAEVERLAAEHALPLRWPGEKFPTFRQWQEAPGACAKTTVLAGLAKLRGKPVTHRVPAVGMLESGRLDEARLLALIDSLPAEGEAEIGCHPGTSPGEVPEDPTWRYDWEGELAALTSAAVKERLRARGIQLCSYAELRAPSRAS